MAIAPEIIASTIAQQPGPLHPANHRWPSFADIPASAGIVIDADGTAYREVLQHTGRTARQGDTIVHERRRVRRSVALSRDEARKLAGAGIPCDYFSPTLGWVRNGLKAESEAFIAPSDPTDDPSIIWEPANAADTAVAVALEKHMAARGNALMTISPPAPDQQGRKARGDE